MNACFRICWRLALVLALALNPVAGLAASIDPPSAAPCNMAGMADAEMDGMAISGLHDSGTDEACPCCPGQDDCPARLCATAACASHCLAVIAIRTTEPVPASTQAIVAGRGANALPAPPPGPLLRPPIA